MTTTESWVTRLGEAVRARREQQDLPIDLSDRGGPSEMTVRKIEAFGSSEGADMIIRPHTKRRLEHALAWPDGWVDKIISGEVGTVEDALKPIALRSGVRADLDMAEPAHPWAPVLAAISTAEFEVRRLPRTDSTVRTAEILREAWTTLADAAID